MKTPFTIEQFFRVFENYNSSVFPMQLIFIVFGVAAIILIPKYLLIIPTIWAIIGTGAAINFGVYQDYVMLISLIIADTYLIKRRKEKKILHPTSGQMFWFRN
jgi:hypothetical protein